MQLQLTCNDLSRDIWQLLYLTLGLDPDVHKVTLHREARAEHSLAGSTETTLGVLVQPSPKMSGLLAVGQRQRRHEGADLIYLFI